LGIEAGKLIVFLLFTLVGLVVTNFAVILS
jgi:hypothetical protein